MVKLEDKFGLDGRTALITGASGRIGIALGELLSSFKCNLIVVDIDEKILEKSF